MIRLCKRRQQADLKNARSLEEGVRLEKGNKAQMMILFQVKATVKQSSNARRAIVLLNPTNSQKAIFIAN